MLILRNAGLVYLANPKTASQAIRAMLRPHAGPGMSGGIAGDDRRHLNATGFARHWAGRLAREFGAAPETLAVMRDPLDHMYSWFRYRQRPALKGHPNSTLGLTFAQFVEARLSDAPSPPAAIGRQDRFLGFIDGGPPVTHVFDFARLDLVVDFLNDRLSARLTLDRRNGSRRNEPPPALPEGLAARYARVHQAELALYERVAEKGHLITR